MFDLKNGSLELRKSAAIQGIRPGEFEPIIHPGNCTKDTDIVAFVRNTRKEIKVDFGDIRAASVLTWEDIRLAEMIASEKLIVE